MPLLQSPMAIFAMCAGLCALVFWISAQTWARRFFSIVPSILFVYYLPTLATYFGLLPAVSPVYDWMRDYLLPFSLFILMLTADLPAIIKIGPKALVMMLFGCLGVILGGVVAYAIFKQWLPPEAWKGMAALSGSWIGGSGNFAAIKEAVAAPDSIIGPIIVVDTVVAYSWMGVLLFLANHQKPLDRLLGGSSDVLQDLNRRMKDYQESQQRPIAVPDLFLIIALGFGGAVISQSLAGKLYGLTHAALQQNLPLIDSILTEFTWLIIIISTAGILLSFTPWRRLEAAGASKVGYVALFLFLTSIGAKANLAGLLDAPVLLLAGVVWICFHILVLFAAARLIKAPMFLVAIGSQANIGGPASAPIVAAAYYEAMAPVGVLMGVLGYLLGNYGGLLCAVLLRLLAG